MSRQRQARDRPRHHVRQSADHRRNERQSPRAQEQVGEQPGQEDVNGKLPRDRFGRADHHPQQERRIEHIAVHRGDIGHAALQKRIPLREPFSVAEPYLGEVSKAVSVRVLIAARIEQDLTGQSGPGERHRRQRERERRPKRRVCRLPGAERRFTCILRRRLLHADGDDTKQRRRAQLRGDGTMESWRFMGKNMALGGRYRNCVKTSRSIASSRNS